MPYKGPKKINLLWYILPVIEVLGLFVPTSWVGTTGSILISLIIFAAAITSIIGFFLIRKKSLSIAVVNLIIGILVLTLFIFFFVVGFLGTAAT